MKKFVSSEAAILKPSWQPGHVFVMSFRLTLNWQEGEKPATDLASFTIGRKEKNLQLTWHPSEGRQNAIISEFEACFLKIIMAKEQP